MNSKQVAAVLRLVLMLIVSATLVGVSPSNSYTFLGLASPVAYLFIFFIGEVDEPK